MAHDVGDVLSDCRSKTFEVYFGVGGDDSAPLYEASMTDRTSPQKKGTSPVRPGPTRTKNREDHRAACGFVFERLRFLCVVPD
jgi:hypothetical protein